MWARWASVRPDTGADIWYVGIFLRQRFFHREHWEYRSSGNGPIWRLTHWRWSEWSTVALETIRQNTRQSTDFEPLAFHLKHWQKGILIRQTDYMLETRRIFARLCRHMRNNKICRMIQRIDKIIEFKVFVRDLACCCSSSAYQAHSPPHI